MSSPPRPAFPPPFPQAADGPPVRSGQDSDKTGRSQVSFIKRPPRNTPVMRVFFFVFCVPPLSRRRVRRCGDRHPLRASKNETRATPSPPPRSRRGTYARNAAVVRWGGGRACTFIPLFGGKPGRGEAVNAARVMHKSRRSLVFTNYSDADKILPSSLPVRFVVSAA